MDTFFDRDLSWLSFNERVLLEAANPHVPLLERIKFLAIYSSNSDEFYRVRMPALMALEKLHKKNHATGKQPGIVQEANAIIHRQQELFGATLAQLIPLLREKHNTWLIYKEPIPEAVRDAATQYFFTQILAFLTPVYLSDREADFFPENNKLYLVALANRGVHHDEYIIINIPSDKLPRFYSVQHQDRQYILILDDIIKENLQQVMPHDTIKALYSFKVTRDAELGIEDEYTDDLAEKIEKQIAKRDFGFATRFLYGAGMPQHCLQSLTGLLNMSKGNVVEGGVYHNLKDLAGLPVNHPQLSYPKWPLAPIRTQRKEGSLFQQIKAGDIILHAPYQSYDTVLRFFNEAAIHPGVEEIYVTLYRIASDSKIAHALISAAMNGKKVTVFVELKARFDEANNIRWAKLMKSAGVKIIYTIPTLKVHAKVALVKKYESNETHYFGLLATGNLNESTARFYTDHILLTASKSMLRELESLFHFLSQRKKPGTATTIPFTHLLVAQFNLQQRFLFLINREIENAKRGLSAGIIIKLNNLEEKVMISKLYEASGAGVNIQLIVRSICCLVPGVKGMSENISVKRIVDRYLEHGRIFVFNNNNQPEVYLGSADWMNRNIYRRIEVCFPVYDDVIRQELLDLIDCQLADNVQAVWLNSGLQNVPAEKTAPLVRSQEKISQLLYEKNNTME